MPDNSEEMFDAIVKTLRRIDDAVVAWIARTPATNADEIGEVRRVMEVHGTLLQILNQLALVRLQAAVAELAAPQQRLGELVTRISATTGSIAEVKEILAIGAAAVGIAAQLVALL